MYMYMYIVLCDCYSTVCIVSLWWCVVCSDDMFYNCTGSASASVVGQSLREERERRAEAERQVQLLEQRLAGELATC